MNENIKYKISLLGDSRVGKTSIFRKLFASEFNQTTLSTIGIDVKTIIFEDIEVKTNGINEKKCFEIAIYDTAGQEKFRTIPRNYIRDSDGIILIYDITNKQSFENIKAWLESISDIISNNNNDNYSIMLLGNKLDLINDKKDNKDIDNNNKVNREVSTEEGEKASKNYNFEWGGECSAKDFTSQQFKDLVKNFTRKIYSKISKTDIESITVTRKNNLKKIKKKCC